MKPGTAALGRLAPGGSPIPLRALRRVFAGGDAERELCAGLADRLGGARVTLHASGREAMRVAFRALAERSGRREVALPAYVCFSVPAAAVAAGLSVRLVDVDESGRLDPESLTRLPLENVGAVVVGNLFGLAEPLGDILAIARAAGVAVIDDAAQALGARSPEGPAGSRSEIGVLSFGRGKPLSALGGGAVAWKSVPPAFAERPPVAARPLAAALRALAYDAARWPPLLGLLSRIPALGIGETVYDPGFAQGAISGPALCLARALLPELSEDSRQRTAVAAELAEALQSETTCRPLVGEPGATAVHPRLAVVAPSAGQRKSALSALRSLGASPLYPTTLAKIPKLQPHLVGSTPCPRAETLASRLFTLPTHAAVRPKIRAIVHPLRVLG
ncbi:MAG: aminotransferase class V-fold PLP-dependent enzyme [Deltaproteobacteria bacterium]|nr:MAG: aminotransferase class V-fold PLP-dependent enzyme [Deltaproteobacteria bacterium]